MHLAVEVILKHISWLRLCDALLLTLYHVIKRILNLFETQEMLEKNIGRKIVLVTGGGSGIGRLMSLRLGTTVVT